MSAGMDRSLIERVLEKLGFSTFPEPRLPGLTELYAAWCRGVPFDNVRKLLHLRSGQAGPLPGDDAEEFFTAWLRHGCGGTCWAGNGALHALLESIGFRAARAVATMVAAPNIPPNHGSVVVDLDGGEYVVDASILHGEPLHMRRGEDVAIDHPAWGVTGRWEDGHFVIHWRNFVTGAGMDCVFNSCGVGKAEFAERYEMTRGWSPFNYSLSLNLLREDHRIGAAWGNLAEIDASGALTQRPVDVGERRRFLVEDAGMSEELACQLPEDLAFAPPPG
jgi:N-hydroxyarylamine O-acetyltransferase